MRHPSYIIHDDKSVYTKRENIEMILETNRNSSKKKSPCPRERAKETTRVNKNIAI